MASPAKPLLQLPRLKTKDGLLKAAPQLARYLAEDGDSSSSAPPVRGSPSPLKGAGAGRRPGSPGAKLGGGSRAYAYEEVTEEERLRQELEKVKAERAGLLSSLDKLRNDAGKSGGELQADDIRLLRREIEAKKEKLNELRRETKAGLETLETLETTSRDCEALMPQGMEGLQARIESLTQELGGVEQEIVEEEAKGELYRLLEARTRREHQAAEQAMREARAAKEDAADDCSVLTRALHEKRAAKEEAEMALGSTVAMYDQVRADWHAKLRDQRKVVRDLQKRRQGEAKAAEAATAAAAERARGEADRSTRAEREREMGDARISAVVPQLEALEATWARLHALTASGSAAGVIAYWQELKAKDANMRELVRLAEEREARAKEQLASLLGLRAEAFDGQSARPTAAGEGEGAAQAAGAGESGEAANVAASASPSAASASASANASTAAGGGEDNSELEALAARIAEAKRRKAAAEKKFARLSQVCVAAEQGLQLLAERLKAAMSRGAEVTTDGSGTHTSERRRTSVMNGSRRLSTVRRSSLGGIKRLSAVGFMEGKRQSQPHTVLLDAGTAADIATHVPAGSGIADRDFFPALPGLVASVSEQLGRLLALEAEMEAAEAMARDASSGQHRGSLAPSEASEAATGGSSPPDSSRVHFADRQTTPRVGEQAEHEASAAADGTGAVSAASGQPASPAAAADGEKQLRKGFRRRTWAGPAWLEGVAGKAPPTALLAKKAAAAAAPSSQAQLRRLVGYVEPLPEDSDEDNEQGQAFGFESEDGSDDEAVVDRHYLKHRAHKLSGRAKAAAAGGRFSAGGL